MLKYLLTIFISTTVFGYEKEYIIAKIRYAAGDDVVLADTLQAMAEVESMLNPDAVGDKNQKTWSYGLFQIKLKTARYMNCAAHRKELLDIDTNIDCAVTYYNYLLPQIRGSGINRIYRTIDAYNRGVSQTKAHPYRGKWKDHKHVGKIIKAMTRIKSERKYNIPFYKKHSFCRENLWVSVCEKFDYTYRYFPLDNVWICNNES